MEEDYNDIEHFLLMSGHTWPSVVARRREFSGWRAFFRSQGFDRIPSLLHSQGPGDAHGINVATLLALQGIPKSARTPHTTATAHHLRNITRVRPGGRWKS